VIEDLGIGEDSLIRVGRADHGENDGPCGGVSLRGHRCPQVRNG
jgi:hypothetical protein